MSKLRDRLEEFKTTFESGAPPYNATREVVATMHRATAELKASGIENTALKVGDQAPDLTLFNEDHVQSGPCGSGVKGSSSTRTVGRPLLPRTLEPIS
jgi:hypothetical protein